MKDLEEAARKTADYLYNIDGEVSPDIYEAIGRLRQLINEEFKPEKSVSSQLIYNIMHPAIEAYIAERERLARMFELEQHRQDSVHPDTNKPYKGGIVLTYGEVERRLDHLSKKGDIEVDIERQGVDIEVKDGDRG